MFNALVQYVKDSWTELKKVVWPSRKETTNNTIMVIILSLVVAAFLGILDFILNKVLELFIV